MPVNNHTNANRINKDHNLSAVNLQQIQEFSMYIAYTTTYRSHFAPKQLIRDMHGSFYRLPPHESMKVISINFPYGHRLLSGKTLSHNCNSAN